MIGCCWLYALGSGQNGTSKRMPFSSRVVAGFGPWSGLSPSRCWSESRGRVHPRGGPDRRSPPRCS